MHTHAPRPVYTSCPPRPPLHTPAEKLQLILNPEDKFDVGLNVARLLSSLPDAAWPCATTATYTSAGKALTIDAPVLSQLARVCPALRAAPAVRVAPGHGAVTGKALAGVAATLQMLQLHLDAGPSDRYSSAIDDFAPLAAALARLGRLQKLQLSLSERFKGDTTTLFGAARALPALSALRLKLHHGKRLTAGMVGSHGGLTGVTSLQLSL